MITIFKKAKDYKNKVNETVYIHFDVINKYFLYGLVNFSLIDKKRFIFVTKF